MDEEAYRSTYQQIREYPCVYEKAQCSLHCHCSQGQMFRLADRHGVSCNSEAQQKQCAQFLNHLRKQTRFVFKINDLDAPLPHNKEIRVQNGGLNGLRELLGLEAEADIDISQLVSQAVDIYHSVDELPYDAIMKSVMAFKARPKRRLKR